MIVIVIQAVIILVENVICQQLGKLPFGYDHKYTYSHLGYNLKITDMQAACGLAQLERLDGFVEKRRDNFDYLKEIKLQDCAQFLIFYPEATGEF